MLEEIGTFVIRMWADAQGLKLDESDRAYWVTCELPEMVQRDTTKYAAAMQQVVGSVVAAMNAKLLTRAVAIEIIVTTARRLGVDKEPAQLLKDVEAMIAQQKTDDADVNLDVGV
jgi:hypothetical protein